MLDHCCFAARDILAKEWISPEQGPLYLHQESTRNRRASDDRKKDFDKSASRIMKCEAEKKHQEKNTLGHHDNSARWNSQSRCPSSPISRSKRSTRRKKHMEAHITDASEEMHAASGEEKNALEPFWADIVVVSVARSFSLSPGGTALTTSKQASQEAS